MQVPMGGGAFDGGAASDKGSSRRKAANKANMLSSSVPSAGGDTYRNRMQLVREAQQKEVEAAERSMQS